MFDELADINMSRYFLAIGIVSLGLLALYAVLWVIRNRPSSPFVKGGRARVARLAVVDATAVDARRRILLVRRDNVEHLIMIGGPTDIVIESRIVDGVDSVAPDLNSALPEPEVQASLAAPKIPLGLALPKFEDESETRASLQNQSQPSIKSQMVPAVAKSVNATNEDPDQADKTRPVRVAAPISSQENGSVADPEAKSSPSLAPTVSNEGSQVQKPIKGHRDIEVRNPYLDAETDIFVPTASKSAADRVLVSPRTSTPDETETQTVAAEHDTMPVVLDDENAGDLLDAARHRVLSSDDDASAESVPPRAETMTEGKPKPEKPKSDFARMLDEEIKTGLPESRYDRPRHETGAQTGGPSGTGAAVPSVAAVKTIGEILNRARSRMKEPIASPEPEQDTVVVAETNIEKKTDKKQTVSSDPISTALETAFENIWNEPTGSRSPTVSSTDKDNWDEDPFLWKPTPDDPRPDFLGRDLPQTDNRVPGRHLSRPVAARDLANRTKR
ncbi:MAG: hypothetical protein RIR97_1005 [Pseudomonadota bacterium]